MVEPVMRSSRQFPALVRAVSRWWKEKLTMDGVTQGKTCRPNGGGPAERDHSCAASRAQAAGDNDLDGSRRRCRAFKNAVVKILALASDAASGLRRPAAPVLLCHGIAQELATRVGADARDDEERFRESAVSIRSRSADRVRPPVATASGRGSVSKRRNLSLSRPSGQRCGQPCWLPRWTTELIGHP